MKSYFDKVFGKNNRDRMKEYWKRLFSSRERKMSEGAQQIDKLITTAHKDQWRRNDHVKK